MEWIITPDGTARLGDTVLTAEQVEALINKSAQRFAEPKTRGVYVTQQGGIIIKDDENDWQRLSLADGTRFEWCNGRVYIKDWQVVLTTIGRDAFPLILLDSDNLTQFAQSF